MCLVSRMFIYAAHQFLSSCKLQQREICLGWQLFEEFAGVAVFTTWFVAAKSFLRDWELLSYYKHHQDTKILRKFMNFLKKLGNSTPWAGVWMVTPLLKGLLLIAFKNIDTWKWKPFLMQTQITSTESSQCMPSFQACYSSLRKSNKSPIH